MNLDFLNPVQDSVVAHTMLLSKQTLGKNIAIHSQQFGMPALHNVKMAIIAVEEGRRAIDNERTGNDFSEIRKHLYQLYQGNWQLKIVDLGNLTQGATVEDTYFALQKVLTYLLKQKIIPILIGGGQDLLYTNYRAYDVLEQTVNVVAIDNKFNFGSFEEVITSQSYLSHIVMNKPNNLFNFTNIGYQTFFNSQEEKDLIDKLYFDAYRLGEVVQQPEIAEPILRNADIVSVNLNALRFSEAPANNNATPNGFYGEAVCALARYAGISDKVTSFGIYEYNAKEDTKNQTAQLIAQIIWYFIEGVNFRANDYPFGSKKEYKKYLVPIDKETYVFYKSHKSGRWWMEINYKINNKNKRHALIPCTYQDYIKATNQELPDLWYKTLKKIQ